MQGALRSAYWRQLAVFGLAIIGVQLIYWQLIDPLLHADRSQAPPPMEIVETSAARIAEPTLEAAAKGDYKPIALPWTHCCDTAIFSVRIAFKVDKVPADGLGIISTLQVDNYRMAVNGSTLYARGRMQPGRVSFDGQTTFLTRIPAGLLRPGVNQLNYITVRNGYPYTDIYPPIISEFGALERFSARRLFLINGFYGLSAAVLGMLGLLAAIMIFRSDDWRFAAWLSALCAAFVAYMTYALWLDPPVDGWGRMLAFFAIYLFIPTALLCFIDSWTRQPLRGLQPAMLVIYGAAMAVIAWYIYRVPMPQGFDTPTSIWIWYLMGSTILVIARLIWHFASQKEDRLIESALLTVMATALVFDASTSWFPQWGVAEGNLLNSSVFLLLAMTAAFLARNFRLFQSQGALNAMLQAKVEQREAELAEAAQREQALIRQQTLDEERRRIMRDLHDGLGSQLMSIMLSARVGVAEPAVVAEGLQSVIDEMRLMVDSMDSVGESLSSALATFKARVQPRIEATGIAFEWHEDPAIADVADFGPRDVLQIFRVLQEAVTNALKHAGGSRIAVRAVREGEGLVLTVDDDGRGITTTGEAGRGLTNMQLRAASVQGHVSVEPGEVGRGTRITLSLPLRETVAAE